jgi:hypothetical protein
MVAETDEVFAESAIALMTDPEARARLERASHNWWEDDQDVGRWSDEYADLYSSLGKGDESR